MARRKKPPEGVYNPDVEGCPGCGKKPLEDVWCSANTNGNDVAGECPKCGASVCWHRRWHPPYRPLGVLIED